MDHVCFSMHVAPRHLEHYEWMHRRAWPELLLALGEAGWRNYSLFLRDDGFLVGHLESADWPAAQSAMDAHEVSARWSAEMDRLVVRGTRMRWLQLEAASGGAPLDGDAGRAVAVGTVPAAAQPSGGRTALFRDPAIGVLISYAEHPVDAEGAAAAQLADPQAAPFRRVFDLERQLAELP